MAMFNAPQQKRSEETLQRILSVCEQLIDQGSFEKARMQVIAKDAGVSVGTLYKRFSSKSAIVDYLVERLQTQQYEGLIAQLSACKTHQLAGRMRYLSDLLHRHCSENSGLIRTVTIAHLLDSSPLSDTTASRSTGLIDEAASWLDDSEDSPGIKSCQRAVAIVAFSFQYSVIYPTPINLLGADVHKDLVCEMALKYLGV